MEELLGISKGRIASWSSSLSEAVFSRRATGEISATLARLHWEADDSGSSNVLDFSDG
jgi:hypothetical protein